MRLFVIFLLLATCCACIYAQTAQNYFCFPGICRRIRCPSAPKCKPNQILKRRAVRCRCCSACVPLLKMGDACIRVKGYPATGKCMRGLRCINRRCSLPQPHRHRDI